VPKIRGGELPFAVGDEFHRESRPGRRVQRVAEHGHAARRGFQRDRRLAGQRDGERQRLGVRW
jgi:hypothetical protein